MTDRELLELAAIAAGADVIGMRGCDPIFGIPEEAEYGGTKYVRWNPLTDDGDALRLAVDLNIAFRNMGHIMAASCAAGQFNEYADGDPYAATRRAITRAAAEIGRSMQ